MTDTNTDQSPPSAAATPFRRSVDDRVFAGVAGGVAARLDIPAWVVRIGFIVLAVGGGFGIALYLAGWLLVPRADEDEPIARRLLSNVEGGPNWIGIGLIAVGVLIAADSIGFVRQDLVLAVLLGVVGYLLYRGDLGGGRPTPDAGEQTQPPATQPRSDPQADAPAAETPEPEEPEPVSTQVHVAEPPPPPPVPEPKPSRPPSILGRVTFAVILIALGVMAFFDFAVTTFDPTPRHYIGLALGLTGVGLLIGSVAGRARGLILLGILTVPWLLAAPLAEFDYSASIGSRDLDPDTVADIAPSYELSIGEMIIDLRSVDFAGADVDLEASVGIGSLEILLPPGVGVDARAQVGLGEAQIFGTSRAGGAREIEVTRTGEGSISIDARTNIGEVVIREAGNGSTATATTGGVGTVFERVESIADLDEIYQLDGGTLTLDLSALVLETPRSVTIRNGIGRIRVIVPDEDRTEVAAAIDFGSIRLFGDEEGGLDLERAHVPTLEPRLILDIVADGGEIVVEEN